MAALSLRARFASAYPELNISRGVRQSSGYTPAAGVDAIEMFPFRTLRRMLETTFWPDALVQQQDNPSEMEANWTEGMQGLVFDRDHWYITNTHNLFRTSRWLGDAKGADVTVATYDPGGLTSTTAPILFGARMNVRVDIGSVA